MKYFCLIHGVSLPILASLHIRLVPLPFEPFRHLYNRCEITHGAIAQRIMHYLLNPNCNFCIYKGRHTLSTENQQLLIEHKIAILSLSYHKHLTISFDVCAGRGVNTMVFIWKLCMIKSSLWIIISVLSQSLYLPKFVIFYE